MLTKNLRDRYVTYRILRRILLDGFAAWKFLFEGMLRIPGKLHARMYTICSAFLPCCANGNG
ncbi:MAG: hypothetical protein IPK99_02240 [Flavobacteriales bacterium]|nr:hypothetical protein [Flavobacteriales bacterium]